MSFTPPNPLLKTVYHVLQIRQWSQTQAFDTKADIFIMTPAMLDFIFPFFVFFYGLMVVVVLENPTLVRLGQERLGEAFTNLSRHKTLAWICFFLGGIWSAQNIWHSSL